MDAPHTVLLRGWRRLPCSDGWSFKEGNRWNGPHPKGHHWTHFNVCVCSCCRCHSRTVSVFPSQVPSHSWFLPLSLPHTHTLTHPPRLIFTWGPASLTCTYMAYFSPHSDRGCHHVRATVRCFPRRAASLPGQTKTSVAGGRWDCPQVWAIPGKLLCTFLPKYRQVCLCARVSWGNARNTASWVQRCEPGALRSRHTVPHGGAHRPMPPAAPAGPRPSALPTPLRPALCTSPSS